MLSYKKLVAGQLGREWRRTTATLLAVALAMGLIIGTGTVMESVQTLVDSQSVGTTASYHPGRDDRSVTDAGHTAGHETGRPFLLFHGVALSIIVMTTGALLFNSFSISLAKQMRLIAALRCVGATPAQVRKLLFTEASFYLFLGAPLGAFGSRIALGLLFAQVRRMSVGNELAELTLCSPPSVYLLGAIIGGVTIFSAALLPACRSAQQSPIDVARGGPNRRERYPAPSIQGGNFGTFRFRFVPLFLGGRNVRRAPGQSAVTILSLSISVLLFVCYGGLLRLTLEANTQRYPLEVRNFRAVALFFYGFMAVIAVIGAVNVTNTLAARLLGRRRELGTLRAIGLDASQAIRVIVWEATLLAVAGLVAGCTAGTLLLFVQIELLGVAPGVAATLPWREMGIGALGLTVMVLPGSYLSALRVIGKPIVPEMRHHER